jgi:hypothetical protein
MRTSARLVLSTLLVLALCSVGALAATEKPKKASEKPKMEVGKKPQRMAFCMGTIEKITPATSLITLKQEKTTATLQVTYSAKTNVLLKKDAATRPAQAKLTDLKTGMYARVQYSVVGDKNEARAIFVAPTKDCLMPRRAMVKAGTTAGVVETSKTAKPEPKAEPKPKPMPSTEPATK